MKTMLFRALALLLSVILLLTCTTACANDPFAETNRLVLCADPMIVDFSVGAAVSEFQRQYPDVELVYEPYEKTEEGRAEYRSRLQVDLIAGSGADVVLFWHDTFDDLYKVMDADVFFDLDVFMESDESFRRDDSFTKILDGGIYHGKRQYVPLTFVSSFLRADTEAMASVGMTLPEKPTFNEWSAELRTYIGSHTQAEVAKSIEEWHRHFKTLFIFSGLQIVDYEAREIVLDNEQLRVSADTYKALLPFPEGAYWDEFLYLRSGNDLSHDAQVANGTQLFESRASVRDIGYWLDYKADGENVPDRMLSFPSFDGDRTVALGETCAAINAASRNKLNAYRFIQAALKVEGLVGGQGIALNGVIKSSNVDANAGASVIDALDGEPTEGYGFILPLEYCRNYSNAVVDIVYSALEPYFADEKPFEDCVAELRNTLELYLYE